MRELGLRAVGGYRAKYAQQLRMLRVFSAKILVPKLIFRQIGLLNLFIFFTCTALYYVVVARRFFASDAYVIGGDTGLIWSAHYFVMQSLKEYLQYPLWDPTTLGGYPAYLLMSNGWFANFHPFHLPYLLAAAVFGHFFHIDSNSLVTFHKTLYLFCVNLIAVMLIARELCSSRLARLVPPLVYSLSSFQFYAIRDSLMVEGLPPVLFFVFALLYHANRRSPLSTLVFLLFLALFVYGFSYPYLLSSGWWVTVISILVLINSPGLVRASLDNVKQLWADKFGRRQLAALVALLAISIAVVALSAGTSIGEIIRASGASPVPYDSSSGGAFAARDVYSTKIWTNFMIWAPFPDIHRNFLTYDPWDAGVYHRYMGVTIIPLLVIAALFGHRRRYVWPMVLTVFFGSAFLIYTADNALYAWLLDNVPPLRNTRVLTYLLPRDVTLLLVFVAGIGIDVLLRDAAEATSAALWRTARIILILILFAAGGLMLASVLPALSPVRHSLAHIAVYLGFSSFIVLILAHGIEARNRPILVCVLLALIGMDLVISDSAFSKLPQTWSSNLPPNSLSMPSPKLGPMAIGDAPWVGAYRGEIHSIFGGSYPYVGTRTWLVLASHPASLPMLQNWDPYEERMKSYPSIRFFSNATYIPFNAIRHIGNVKVPLYVIKQRTLLVQNGSTETIQFADRSVPIESGQAGYVENATPGGPDSVAFSGWAIDERAGRGARQVLVFVGDTLWDAIPVDLDRNDIAPMGEGFRRSGFAALLRGVPKTEQQNVRVFALLSDGTARELHYSKGYPFSRGFGPGPGTLREPPAAGGPPTFYVHDPAAVLPNRRGHEEKLSWAVTDWSPNHYSLEVLAPSDGYLLNLENYNRYWRAFVDGKPARIWRANFTMQAIRLNQGDHKVEWRYRPWPFEVGWSLFYLVFAIVLAGFKFNTILSNRAYEGNGESGR